MSFITKVKLLDSYQTIEELKLKDFRNLLKCFLGDDIDSDLIFSNTNIILQKVCNTTLDTANCYNFVDYLILLLRLRATSIGNIVSLHAETDSKKQLKINLNIESIIDNIFYEISKVPLTDIVYDNVTLVLQIPSINDIFQFEANILTINTIFIKTIKLNNLIICLSDLEYSEREKIIKSLPIKLIVQLDLFIDSFIKNLNNINLLKNINSKDFDRVLPLTLNTQVLAFIIKLIFNFDLESVYNSLFLLSKGANLDSNFLDNCSPGEFLLFSKKLEEMYHRNDENNSITIDNNDDLPPINPNSQFTLE